MVVGLKVRKMGLASSKCDDVRLLSLLQQCIRQVNVNKKIALRIADEVETPLTVGTLFPVIYVPAFILENVNEGELKHILLHELVHIRRKDTFFAGFGVLLVAIHWFNPVMWFAFTQSKKDCELACDEKVLHILAKDEHMKYGETLIKILGLITMTKTLRAGYAKGLIEHRAQAFSRIEFISGFYKRRKWVIVLSTCLVMVTLIMGLMDDQSIRMSQIIGNNDLLLELSLNENQIRSTNGIFPDSSYYLVMDEPYRVLEYNHGGKKVHYWFDGSVGNRKTQVSEITTVSFLGIHQGMDSNKALDKLMKHGYEYSGERESDLLTAMSYMGDGYLITLFVEQRMNKVYCISLQKMK
jgi:hypothetical protein